MVIWEKPDGWFHLHLGEARSSLEFLVDSNGSVLIHLYGSEEELTVNAGKVLARLKKCICSSKELRNCTCDSLVYQDREGVYHFMTHSLLIAMDARGEEVTQSVVEAGR